MRLAVDTDAHSVVQLGSRWAFRGAARGLKRDHVLNALPWPRSGGQCARSRGSRRGCCKWEVLTARTEAAGKRAGWRPPPAASAPDGVSRKPAADPGAGNRRQRAREAGARGASTPR